MQVELFTVIVQSGALGLLAAVILWLGPKALRETTSAREKLSQQHSDDINRICAVFQEQMRYERDQCAKDLESAIKSVVDRLAMQHAELVRLVERRQDRGEL